MNHCEKSNRRHEKHYQRHHTCKNFVQIVYALAHERNFIAELIQRYSEEYRDENYLQNVSVQYRADKIIGNYIENKFYKREFHNFGEIFGGGQRVDLRNAFAEKNPRHEAR